MASPPGPPSRRGPPRGPGGDGPRPPRREGFRTRSDGPPGPRGPRREDGPARSFGGPERPRGPRPEGQGERPYRPRSTGDRPTGDRPQGDRQQGERPYRPRPEGDRPPGDRPFRARPAGDRPQGDRPQGERPYRPRPEGDRPPGERTFRPRTEGGFRPRTDDTRPPRTEGDRPYRPRPAADRPPRDGARPFGERPAAPRRAREEPDASYATPRATHAGSGLWIYGLHAVAAALANPARHLRRLMLTEEAQAALTERMPPPWPLTPEITERARMDGLLGHDTVHQGAAVLADPLNVPTLQALLERPGPVLVLDQVTDPRNVGAILRSAAAFGVAGVIVQERNAPEETGALAKAASGALESVPLLRAVNLARTLVALKAANVWTVGLAADAPPLSGPALAQRRVALVLGAEGDGMRRLTRETCDELAGLRISGSMESLNVSAAAAIALYELARPA